MSKNSLFFKHNYLPFLLFEVLKIIIYAFINTYLFIFSTSLGSASLRFAGANTALIKPISPPPPPSKIKKQKKTLN